MVRNGIGIPYGTTWIILTVFIIAGVLLWLPLYRNIKKDIARVDEYNKKIAEKIKDGSKNPEIRE
ncbi:MAG: hypothetical protein ACFFCS_00930 [Candidatus Hodarchaeota archaeon]